MASFYEEMQGVATELLTEFNQGQPVYVKLTPGNGPKTNPGPSTRTPYDMKGATNGVSAKYVDGNLVLASDLQVIAAVDPRFERDNAEMMKDLIVIDGKDHKIIAIKPKPASGTRVANLFIIRRGA